MSVYSRGIRRKTFALLMSSAALPAVNAMGQVHPVGIPVLNSRPGAAYNIYLDFGGFTFTGNWGNGGGVPGTTPAFDNVTTSFGPTDQGYIQQIWSRVAEKYAAFNVNVTTVDPSVLGGQSGSDPTRQLYFDETSRMMHTVIGDSNWTGGGGISYVGVTQYSYGSNPGINSGDGIGYHTNWLITNHLGGAADVSAIAEAGAHENGHGFGLNHQSDFNGSTLVNEYSSNNNSTGGGSLAPIMGVSYYSQRGVWRSGTADAGGLSQQNDVQVILGNSGMTTLMDDGIGHTTATATAMPIRGTTVDYMRARGIIEPASSSAPNPTGVANYTTDVYAFSSNGGIVSLTLKDGSERITPGTADGGATLVSTLSILNSSGGVLYTASNTNNTSESITQTLPAGSYYAQVQSLGGETGVYASSTNYYYDMGSYFLTGSGIVSSNTGAFYWTGGASTAKWNQVDGGTLSNWRTDHTAGTDPAAAPTTTSNVFFTVDAGASSLVTTLGASRTVNSLSFTGTSTSAGSTSVTIAADGSTLSLNPLSGFIDGNGTAYPIGTGLVVQAGSAAHTIAANVALVISQTWQINNSAANPLTVSGTISGSGNSLSVTGTGKLIFSHANTYNGGSYVMGGTVNFVNGGLGTGIVTIANGAILQYATGNTQDLTSAGLIISTGGGQIDTNGNNVTYNSKISGPAGGYLTKLGTGGLTLNSTANPSNLFVRGGTVTLGSSASLTTVTPTTSNVNNYSSIGQSSGDNGTLTLGGSAVFTGAGDVNIGDVSAVGVLNINGSATVNARTLAVGKYVTSNGTINQTGGTLQEADNGAGAADWRIGGYGGTADSAAVGVYNLSGGTLNSSYANFQVGAFGTGSLIQTGGNATVGGYLSIGRFAGGIGTWDMSSGNGTLTATAQPRGIVGEAGTGTLKVGGLSTLTAQAINLAYDNGANGTVNQTGGIVTTSSGIIFGGNLTSGTAATAIYTLSAGVLATSSVTQQSGVPITGTFNFNHGTLRATSNGVSLMNGITNANVQAGGAIIDTNSNSVSVDQVLRHDPALGATPDGGLIKIGTGTLGITAIDTYTGTTNISAGTMAVSATGKLPTGGAILDSGILNFNAPIASGILTRTQGQITLNSGASLNLLVASPHANRTLLIASGLTLAGTSTVDLANNDMIVQNGNIGTLSAVVGTAYANGAWNGSGITSTTAAGDPTHLTAVGVILNTTLYGSGGSLGLFDGANPGINDVLIKYTYYGDTNLSGTVNSADYTRLDSAYLADQSNPTGYTGWANGDFNYDTVINGSDYTLIDNAFNTQGATLAASVANPSATVAAEIAAVPEPGMVGVLAALGIGILSRRRSSYEDYRWSRTV